MIFVSMSTSYFQFRRLVAYVEAVSEKFDDHIIVQVGHTEPVSHKKGVTYLRFVALGAFEEYCRKAHLVISQGGVGVLMSCLRYGTPLILVPRLKAEHETETDHQLEMVDIVKKIGATEQVIVVETQEEIIQASRMLYGKRFAPRSEGELPRSIASWLRRQSDEVSL